MLKQLPGFRLDATLTAPTPGVIALFGRSGSGKSTLTNVIAGLLTPDVGTVSLDGECRARGGEGELDSEMGAQPGPKRRPHPEQQQQHVTHRDGRQHERQVHECIEQQAAREARPRQHPGGKNCKGQAEAHAARGDLETQAQRLQLGGVWRSVHSDSAGVRVCYCSPDCLTRSGVTARPVARRRQPAADGLDPAGSRGLRRRART